MHSLMWMEQCAKEFVSNFQVLDCTDTERCIEGHMKVACHFGLVCSSPYTHCHPASTTLSNLKLSSGSSLGTSRLTIPTFWITFCPLVGLKYANFCVSALPARTLLSAFMQAICWSVRHRKLILWPVHRIYLHLEHCSMHWQACTAVHSSCTNIDHQPLIQEYELMPLLKSLLFRSWGSPTCIFHGPKEFTKTVQVLGLIQLKQWFYKITPCSTMLSYRT